MQQEDRWQVSWCIKESYKKKFSLEKSPLEWNSLFLGVFQLLGEYPLVSVGRRQEAVEKNSGSQLEQLVSTLFKVQDNGDSVLFIF